MLIDMLQVELETIEQNINKLNKQEQKEYLIWKNVILDRAKQYVETIKRRCESEQD